MRSISKSYRYYLRSSSKAQAYIEAFYVMFENVVVQRRFLKPAGRKMRYRLNFGRSLASSSDKCSLNYQLYQDVHIDSSI